MDNTVDGRQKSLQDTWAPFNWHWKEPCNLCHVVLLHIWGSDTHLKAFLDASNADAAVGTDARAVRRCGRFHNASCVCCHMSFDNTGIARNENKHFVAQVMPGKLIKGLVDAG